MGDHGGQDRGSSAPSSVARRRVLQRAAVVGLASSLPRRSVLAQGVDGSPAVGSAQPALAETLASYAAGLRYEDLPSDVVRMAKRTILDTIGCAFAGYAAGPSRIAMKLAGDVTAKQAGTVLISGIRTSPERAAFANGVMIRYLDFNDAYVSRKSGPGHPSDTLAALLVAAELGGRNGRDLIAATVLAYEVYCKIADVYDYTANGIDHTTVTGMAATVGAGWLMGLTPDQMVQAIGITVGGNTATGQGRSDALSNWKTYAAADACRKAIFSVQLARDGMTGPKRVFEGTYGFFKVMSREPVAPPRFGEPFGIRTAFTKRFPLGQFSQTVAQAAVEARSSFKGTDDIAAVNINVSRAAITVMADSPDKWRPQTHETADHSMPYAAGLVLLYGKIDPAFYEDPYLHDPRLLDLVGRIKVMPLVEADQPELANLCVMELVLASGARKTVRVEHHRGHYKNPMTDAEMEDKFRTSAQRYMRPEAIDILVHALWTLEDEQQVSSLIDMTRLRA